MQRRHYIQEIDRAAHNPHETRFSDVIAKHAAMMVKLAQPNPDASIWDKISRVNDTWVNLICPVIDPVDNFHKIVNKLVRGYTDVLSDAVINDRVDPDQLEKLINVSSKFYEKMASHRTRKLQGLWARYTGSIVDMARERRQGVSDNYYIKARQCILTGRLLGSELDFTLFS